MLGLGLQLLERVEDAAGLEPGRSVHGERAYFRRLVLFCIEASDSESRRIFHRFSRSTRLSLLRTAPNPKFQQKLAKIFHNFTDFLQNFAKFLSKFGQISTKFHQNFTARKVPHPLLISDASGCFRMLSDAFGCILNRYQFQHSVHSSHCAVF